MSDSVLTTILSTMAEQDGTSDDPSVFFGSILRHFGGIKAVLDVVKAKPRFDDKVQHVPVTAVTNPGWFHSKKGQLEDFKANQRFRGPVESRRPRHLLKNSIQLHWFSLN